MSIWTDLAAAARTGGTGQGAVGQLSDEELIALLGGGQQASADYANSNLPYGFTFNRATGLTYRQDANGQLVPATPQEVQQAVLAESQMGQSGSGGGAAPPRPESMIDPRSGELILIDPYTGAVTRTGNQLGFAGIDPREEFAAEQQQQGFQNELQKRAQAINLLDMAQNNVLRLSQMAEQGKMDRAGLTESARSTDLRAAVDQWQTAMNLIPQMGQLSIQESQRVQDILQNGGDFLARAFESRGGTSPLAKVTQADQINALGQTLTNLRGMVQQNTAASPAPGGRGTIPGYEAPVLPEGNIPELPGFQPYQLSAAPAVTPPQVAPSPSGSGGFGGLATPEPAAPETNWGPPAYPRGAAPQEFPTPRGYQDYGTPAPTQSAPLPWAYGQNPEPQVEMTGGNAGTNLLGNIGNAASAAFNNPVSKFARNVIAEPWKGIGGFNMGGMTNDKMFVGNEDGPELYMNPTGAPIAVVPADETAQMVEGNSDGTFEMKGYEEGTEAGGMWSSRERNRFLTNRNLNEFQSSPAMQKDAMNIAAGGIQGFGKAAVNLDRDRMLLRQAQIAAANASKITPDMEQALWALRQATGIRGNIPGFATGTGVVWDNNPELTTPSYTPGGHSFVSTNPAGFSVGANYHVADPNDPNDAGYYNPTTPGTPKVNQKELIDLARRNAPPAVTSVINGGTPPARTALESQAVPGRYLKGITARQFQSMTPEEVAALGTLTNTEFNAPLDFVTNLTSTLYGPSGARRGFLGSRGL